MSAIHHPPLGSKTSSRSPYLSGQPISGQPKAQPMARVRPNMADRLSQILHEIEAFLRACTYEEMCNFWEAIANLRQCLQSTPFESEVPQFLTERRKHRDFCRILEVLADLPYPKLHLSSNLSSQLSDHSRYQQPQPYSAFGYHHSASFNASLN